MTRDSPPTENRPAASDPASEDPPNNSDRVTRKLEKTSIAEKAPTKDIGSSEAGREGQEHAAYGGNGALSEPADPKDTAMADSDAAAGRGLRRKRSYDEVDPEIQKAGKHVRKRSRESSPSGRNSLDVKDEDAAMSSEVYGDAAKINGDPARLATPPLKDLPMDVSSAGNLAVGSRDDKSASTTSPGKRNREESTSFTQGRIDNQAAEKERDEPRIKRARDSSTPPSVNTDNQNSSNSSPKSSIEKPTSSALPDTSTAPEVPSLGDSKPAGEAPSTEKVPSTSGFSNTSTASPFGNLAGSKSPTPSQQPQTSMSAFASSGFGKLAGSASPFAAAGGMSSLGGASKSSPWAKPASPAPAAGTSSASPSLSLNPSPTAESKSPFAVAETSGFKSFGGGFGGTGGFGSLSGGVKASFGAGSAPPISGLSNEPVRAFGAPATGKEKHEESDNESEEGRIKSPKAEEPKKHEGMPAGEEHEFNAFTARGKLFAFVTEGPDKKAWKERCLGSLKLNITSPTDDDFNNEAPKKGRLIMRADGSGRMALNSPIMKDLLFGGDKPPTNGQISFQGVLADDGVKSQKGTDETGKEGESSGEAKVDTAAKTGKPQPLMLKMSVKNAEELYKRVLALKESTWSTKHFSASDDV
ncbi:hypothetical protein K402DRAFT_397324 [Aulographum hederae CBS 113979]|uniref:RanBD1 domain-containing protein n=1 Tax=Aulographum hederae CBS 113979 TaxID=1176131 RepID=A0A6G1GPB6_9PEZI|nr:hypothetical protein K402DRAFT_397324 [Aulographum hederae CBS 113979]